MELKNYVLRYKGSCDAQLEPFLVLISLFFYNPGHRLSKNISGAFQHLFPRLRRIVWFAFTFERHARQVIKKIAISSSYQLFYRTLCSSDGLSAQKQLKVFFRVQDREKYSDKWGREAERGRETFREREIEGEKKLMWGCWLIFFQVNRLRMLDDGKGSDNLSILRTFLLCQFEMKTALKLKIGRLQICSDHSCSQSATLRNKRWCRLPGPKQWGTLK